MKDYNLPPVLLNNLLNIAYAVKQKLQRVIFVDGEQRSGKSNLAKALAGKLAQLTNADFDHTHVFFDVGNIIKFLSDNRGEIVILDEAAFDLMSTDWQKKDQQLFLKMLYTAAKNHHTLFILIPELSALSYNIVKNGHALFRTYMKRSNKGYYKRGFFFCYDKKSIKQIYFKEKNKLRVPYPAPGFKGRCPDVTTDSLVIDEAMYEKRKDEAIKGLYHVGNADETVNTWMKRFYRVAEILVAEKITHKSKIVKSAGMDLNDYKKGLELYLEVDSNRNSKYVKHISLSNVINTTVNEEDDNDDN